MDEYDEEKNPGVSGTSFLLGPRKKLGWGKMPSLYQADHPQITLAKLAKGPLKVPVFPWMGKCPIYDERGLVQSWGPQDHEMVF